MHHVVDPPKIFAGRVAVVAGDGCAIGGAIAEKLGAVGAAVAVVGMSRARADATVGAVIAAGGRATRFTASLYDLQSVPGLIRRIVRELGEIDILVNNTLAAPLDPLADIDSAEVLRALTINVASVITLAGAVLPSMRRRGWGRIVNVCDVDSLDSMPGGNVFTICVAALEAHTMNLAIEVAGTGVTVNALRAQTMDSSVRDGVRAIDERETDDRLFGRSVQGRTDDALVDSVESARILVRRLTSTETGSVWGTDHRGP
jgi:NAD(P)-dependent dehydrogenase (short-subunit alcohol dehydrogenase family)